MLALAASNQNNYISLQRNNKQRQKIIMLKCASDVVTFKFSDKKGKLANNQNNNNNKKVHLSNYEKVERI
jgi:hypothetical protein